MKKINIFLMAALALGFASCEDKSDLGIAQVTPQLPTFTADGFSVSGVPTSVNLDANVNKDIPVVTVSSVPENLPEGAKVVMKMQLASDDTFENAEDFNVINGAVSADDWENFVMKGGSKSPANVTNYIRFAAYVLNDSQLSRLGGENVWYGTTAVTVTPVDLRLDVESSYSIVTDAGRVEMNHSDAHVYDDPIFTYTIEVSDDQVPYYWQIAGSGAELYGVSDTGAADALEGNLVLGGQKGELTAAGKYKMTANMLDKTYKIEKNAAPETDNLWTPGPANGWGFENNMLLVNQNNGSFSGYVYVDGEFKLCAQPSWDVNWGLNGGVMTPGGDNIKVDPTGLYFVVADFNEMTVALTEITRIGVIGDFNGWGSDVALTPNETYNVWSGDVDFASEGGWKFRMNDAWDLNLGGAMDDLVQNGSNILLEDTGVYTVTLDLSKLPYSCTIVKK